VLVALIIKYTYYLNNVCILVYNVIIVEIVFFFKKDQTFIGISIYTSRKTLFINFQFSHLYTLYFDHVI